MRSAAIQIAAAFGTAVPAAAWVWLVAAAPPPRLLRAAVIVLLAAAAAAVLFAAGRRRAAVGWCLGVYGGACAASLVELATGLAPLLLTGSLPAISAGLASQTGLGKLLLLLPAVLGPVCAALWCEAVGRALSGPSASDGRKRARSDLHGASRLMARPHLRRLEHVRDGIILGQTGVSPRSPLATWPLEGSAVSLAPPRTGKGALIAANMLAPDGRGWPGSTVSIDPRGELFCTTARRRREMGRRVILLDPFGLVAKLREDHPECHLPDVATATYNPLDFVRSEERAVEDIGSLVEALLTPPGTDAGNSRHFHESARRLISGYLAWARYRALPEAGGGPPCNTLEYVHQCLSAGAEARDALIARIRELPEFASGLAHRAVESQSATGEQESGSNYTTMANQMQFLSMPEIRANTARSSFDPMALAEGDTDLYVVLPEEQLGACRPWLRLWVSIPYLVATRVPLRRDMLIVIDELPRLGLLQPVVDAYAMGAGRGVHFWSFAQSLSAMESTWGRENTKVLLDLAEVVQVLGWPRLDTEGAERLSAAIGNATFENRTETSSGSPSASLLGAGGRASVGDSQSVVKERVVGLERFLMLGPEDQYVLGASKALPRDGLHLRQARYWRRRDTRRHADPNPYVVRKGRAASAAADRPADPFDDRTVLAAAKGGSRDRNAA